MKPQNPASPTDQFYSGGLAETVSKPTRLTYSFLAHWFCGKRSLGIAMRKLGLPCEETAEPLVVMHEGDLLVDLKAEEKTLYSQTVFRYKKQEQFHALPVLQIAYERLFSPRCLLNTIKIVLYQSQLISDPQKYIALSKGYIAHMPSNLHSTSLRDIDRVLTEEIWPAVIGIGALCEFYSRLLEQAVPNQREYAAILSYIGSRVCVNDWFFTSLSHQAKVRLGKMSFEEYLEHYGIRARKDYEISCPRWYEEREHIYSQIKDTNSKAEKNITPEIKESKKISSYIDAVITLQIIRSEARRIALIWIDALRQEIRAKVGNDMAHYTREEILKDSVVKKSEAAETKVEPKSTSTAIHGKGMPVSPGKVCGTTHYVTSSFESIPSGTIGIFPNASTDFTILYTKCTGIIFLSGGQTSHGAIVSREFNIPSLVDSNAAGIAEGSFMEIDGKEGEWKIL